MFNRIMLVLSWFFFVLCLVFLAAALYRQEWVNAAIFLVTGAAFYTHAADFRRFIK